jgi:hypothetical protein
MDTSVILVNAIIFSVFIFLREARYHRVCWTCFFFEILYHVSLLVRRVPARICFF